MIGEIGGTAEEQAAEYVGEEREEAGGGVHRGPGPHRRAAGWATRARSSAAAAAVRATRSPRLTKAGIEVARYAGGSGQARVQKAIAKKK